MAGILAPLEQFKPSFALGGAVNVITFAMIVIIIAMIAFIVSYLWIMKKKFKYKIVVFEKINGIYQPSRRDIAAEIKVGDTGDKCLFLKKHKKHLPTPVIQTGPRTFWFVIREDQEWINIGIEDIDLKMRKAGVKYLDKEMRYARIALEEGLKSRYDKPNFFKEYGVIIASVGFIVIIGIMTWLLFDKWIELAGITNAGVQSSKEVMELAKQILVAVDNIKAGTC